jgi:hypothetical protein
LKTSATQERNLNLNYYIDQIIDKHKQDDIHDYFMNSETDSLEEALNDPKSDGLLRRRHPVDADSVHERVRALNSTFQVQGLKFDRLTLNLEL